MFIKARNTILKMLAFVCLLWLPYFLVYGLGILVLSLIMIVRPTKCEKEYIPMFFAYKEKVDNWFVNL